MESQSPEDQPRAEGPAVVESGEPNRPRLLVLDPAGAGKHGDIPASWRELADDAHVTWLRLPAADAAVATARATLSELASGGQRVHLVASGEAAPLAELLALQQPGSVASVLLVDRPKEPTSGLVKRGTTVVEQALLTRPTAASREALGRHGVALLEVSHLDADRAEQGAPLPLGHPMVVDAVRRALAGQPVPPRATTVKTRGRHKRPTLLARLVRWIRARLAR